MNTTNFEAVFIFVFLCLATTIHVVLAANYIPSDKIFLNCGGPPETTDSNGLKWTSDVGSKFASGANSTTSPAATQDPAVPQVPFMTARVFRSEYTYKFPVASGRKFIRLYFYPASYAGLNASNAIFTVTAQSYTILKNFSVAQTTEALDYVFITKEFSVNVEGETLDISFAPSSSVANAYAFVNGIEIVSMPDIYSATDGTTMIVGQSTPFFIDNSTALENVYRINVGGNDISPPHDTGLFRSWYDDTQYLLGAAFGVPETADPNMTVKYPMSMPTYVAPEDVYTTARSMGPNPKINLNYNLTWIFSIDSGFSYLVRLHFCEVAQIFTKVNQRVFDIFLNNQTAVSGADVVAWTGGNGIPVYKDYVVFVPMGSPQVDLWLELHPDTSAKPNYYDAILNGVEIFKINDTTGNLGGPNLIPLPKQDTIDPTKVRPSSGHGKAKSDHKAIIAGGVSGGIVLALVLGFFAICVARRRRQGKDSSTSEGPSGWLPLSLYGNSQSAVSAKTNTTGSYTSSLPSNLCRHFSFAEIKSATKNFDEALLLGVGGFGKVYKGEIDGGATQVAIKRGNPLSEQGVHEFQTEIEMLSKLRHRHLVSLIGYCEENCEMILVYDYMAYGTLREHLYKTQKPPLPWKQRLEICIGAARGLHYLHTGPTLDNTHVSTVVKGSFGYLDPEYFRRQQLTEKSDVYSFGVVLFEILCARPALNPSLPKEQVSLAEWAAHCHKKGSLDHILDPYLKGKITPECFKKFAETAMKCVSDQSIDRPSMGDVLWNLEFALQLQESAEESGKGIGAMELEEEPFMPCKGKKDPDAMPAFDGNVTDSRSSGMSMSIGGRSLASDDSDGLTPSAVFSQIMNPKGR
ncbi:receptor-like protein kinase FERONIA [Prunus yedoensis var. nudiflora]|uniref:Receptor-like protein kinase FERONIA n=1 Tax=Prunus yedoensis var. nudiflora TaxID=2094558 RepID=A0A314YSV2_PRUYE|nr:receptor-like protein kinase FERONIA [Prunus yedoensis var. nudiflora]